MSTILKYLDWVYPGAEIVGPSGTTYKVVQADESGYWLKNQFDGTSDRWTRGEILLTFKPAPVKTRFERIDQ